MKLYRSTSNQMLGGVCGGLAAYVGVDVTWVRLFWVLLALSNSFFTLLYFILWLIMPSEEQAVGGGSYQDYVREGAGDFQARIHEMGSDVRQAVHRRDPQAGVVLGAALIIAGVLVLLDNLNIPGLAWIGFDMLWPVLLIIGGVVLLTRQARVLDKETENEG